MNNGHVKPHTSLPIANSITWFAILKKILLQIYTIFSVALSV